MFNKKKQLLLQESFNTRFDLAVFCGIMGLILCFFYI